jgi:hypothetical protein
VERTIAGRCQPKNKPNRSKRLRQGHWSWRFDKACSFLIGGGETQLRWHDNFAQDPIVVVRRVAQAADVDLRAISQAFENRYFT